MTGGSGCVHKSEELESTSLAVFVFMELNKTKKYKENKAI